MICCRRFCLFVKVSWQMGHLSGNLRTMSWVPSRIPVTAEGIWVIGWRTGDSGIGGRVGVAKILLYTFGLFLLAEDFGTCRFFGFSILVGGISPDPSLSRASINPWGSSGLISSIVKGALIVLLLFLMRLMFGYVFPDGYSPLLFAFSSLCPNSSPCLSRPQLLPSSL